MTEIGRRPRISQGTYFNWNKKYEGMTAPETRRLKLLEEENAKLKQAMDFVHDQLTTGQKLRVLTIMDTFSWFCPGLDARFRYRAEDVVARPERVC